MEYRSPVTHDRSFGEEGRRLSYGGYLKVPELLGLQARLSEEHDELLFIVVHQAYELWFKVILGELETIREAISGDDVPRAVHLLRRVRAIEQLLVEQVEVIETMSPQEFLAFRDRLAPASGFQSVQFREIEFISGLKDPEYLDRLDATPDERARLERRLADPSLWDAFEALRQRHGAPELVSIYRESARHASLLALAEALLDHDAAFVSWRMRHVLMVEREIGAKPGTGGSSGAHYLRSTIGKRFFPALWQVRSEL